MSKEQKDSQRVEGAEKESGKIQPPDCPYCSRAAGSHCDKCDTYFCNDCIDDHDCSVFRD